jgi:hypothetical protein
MGVALWTPPHPEDFGRLDRFATKAALDLFRSALARACSFSQKPSSVS